MAKNLKNTIQDAVCHDDVNKDRIYVKLLNNTGVPQNVILFDTAGAYNSINAIVSSSKFVWDLTAELVSAGINSFDKLIFFAKQNQINASYVPYNYTNPGGTFTTVGQIVTALNSFGIGTFANTSGNLIEAYSSDYI